MGNSVEQYRAAIGLFYFRCRGVSKVYLFLNSPLANFLFLFYYLCNSFSHLLLSIMQISEYASIVWDGCSVHDADKLEKVQLCAARIVTGLPIFVPREALYLETGWEILQTRRYIACSNLTWGVSLIIYVILFLIRGKIYRDTTHETRISLMYLSAG